MGFTSIDDLVTEITVNGKFQRVPFTRVLDTGATSVAGRWHEGFTAAGTGGTGSLTSGSAGVGVAMSSATTGALPQGSASVSPDTKHLLGMSAVTATATVVPAWLMLTDLLYQYPLCVVTGSPTTMDNTAAKPARFNSGVGVQVSAIVVGALGAATPSLTVSYTNQSGVSGRTGTMLASATSLPVGALLGGGAAGSLTGPYLLLAAGDSGAQQINSYTIDSGSTTGQITFVLHRPIATLPLVAANVAGERDFLNQMPALPKIEDAACLALLAQVGGAMIVGNSLSGELLMGWG